ncbi:MAG: S41 family peptidase [Candidatus Vecturithrix sp.]|jgi:hypothetical protein|nr:S41 family peptidase [Candidatus Vecturithrix sp.]
MRCQKGSRKPVIICLFVLGLAVCQILQAEDLMYSLEELGCTECNAYQLDFLYLVKLLQDSHPNVYANFPKEDFNQEKARLLKEFETIDDLGTYALRLQQFCARMSDLHTAIGYYNVLRRTDLSIFPIALTVLQDEFYLTNFDMIIDPEWLGAKIIEVNDLPMSQVAQKLGELASCENDVCRNHNVGYFLREPQILEFMRIIRKGEPLTLSVETLEGVKQTLIISANARTEVEWIDLARKHHAVTVPIRKPFSYTILPEHRLCYFQFNEFFDRQALKFLSLYMGKKEFTQRFGSNPKKLYQVPDLQKFLSRMFADLQQQQIDCLVIDLRNNSGGNSLLGIQIMYYLQDFPEMVKGYAEGIKFSLLMQHQYPDLFDEEKQRYEDHYGEDTLSPPMYVGDLSEYREVASPHTRTYRYSQFFRILQGQEPKLSMFAMELPKTKFAGKIFILIGTETASSASDFATTLSDNRLAILIGQPIRQKPTSFGDMLFFQLPHTSINGHVSYKIFYRPDAAKDDDPTLYPDIEVWPTIDDIMNGRDPVFDKVLELIEQE